MIIKEPLKTIKKYFLKGSVKRDLVKRYERQLETELLLEQWIIKRITEDQQLGRRKELTEKQAAIREIEEFLTYLKTI